MTLLAQKFKKLCLNKNQINHKESKIIKIVWIFELKSPSDSVQFGAKIQTFAKLKHFDAVFISEI